jgi:hypothetical protein
MATNCQPGIFISYSHEDEPWKKRVALQLGVLSELGMCDAWDDRRIGVGEHWKQEIDAAMDRAFVAVLLISAHFLTSPFIKTEEVPRLLARRPKGLLIVPVIVSPCLWQRIEWLAELQVRPKDGQPLSLFPEPQVAQVTADLAEEIATHFDKLARSAPATPVEPVKSIAATEAGAPQGTASPDPLVETKAAVQAVTDTAADPGIKTIVTASESELKAVGEQFALIQVYKELHDELHRFETEIFADLLSVYDRIGSDPRARENAAAYADALLATAHQVRAVAERLPCPSYETAWIDRLMQAHRNLAGAITAQSENHAAVAVGFLTRVIDTEPPRLNGKLIDLARRLDVTPLVAALGSMCAAARNGRLRLDPAILERGAADLARFSASFRALAEEHDAWQEADAELRVAEASVGQSLVQLEIIWDTLGPEVEKLHAGKSGRWAMTLRQSAAQLQQGIAAHDPARAGEVREAFRRFRRDCARRFYDVDVQLREECDKLAELGTELQLLIRTIQTTDL